MLDFNVPLRFAIPLFALAALPLAYLASGPLVSSATPKVNPREPQELISPEARFQAERARDIEQDRMVDACNIALAAVSLENSSVMYNVDYNCLRPKVDGRDYIFTMDVRSTGKYPPNPRRYTITVHRNYFGSDMTASKMTVQPIS